MVEPRLPWPKYQDPEPRPCVREEYIRHPIYDGSVVHTWTYHYSDGTKETVTMTERKR